MDLDPIIHQGLKISKCGTCNLCCDGSLFTAGFVPLIDFTETANCFPIVFHKIYGEYWPGMIYALKPGLPCPYLDQKNKQCSIYHTFRPVACHHFPFRFKAKEFAEKPPFVSFPYTLEMDERCPSLGKNQSGQILLNRDGSLSEDFIESIRVPSRVDFVQETQRFCRQLDRFQLFKKKSFKLKSKTGKKKRGSRYLIIDKSRLFEHYPEFYRQYAPYIDAHWKSLKKPRKLIESVYRDGGKGG
jgi:Fe-S-cluster containining protein